MQEGGIFDALQTGYLEAIQLSICADSSRPSEIVECYTFTVTYTSSSGQTGRNVSSITVSPDPHTAFFVGDAQKSFNTAIKGLLRLIRGLPQLPRE
jgi:HORMA domain